VQPRWCKAGEAELFFSFFFFSYPPSFSPQSKERGWRHKYDRHVMAHVKASLQSPEAALKSAQAGLESLHSTFEFHRDGEKMSVQKAMDSITGTCQTGVIKGTGQAKEFELPYKGRTLRGQQIVDLANKWAAKVRVWS
jgi:hypothetical protein